MIISGGYNVYPAEVEAAVARHPGVAEVAVIGVPDERWGEAVKAVVVARPGAASRSGRSSSTAPRRWPVTSEPQSVDFVDALPKGATGKILRRVLREPYWAGRDRHV